MTVSECCSIKLLLYYFIEKFIHILALEMTSPGNQHCADCIGTLSYPVYEERSRLFPTAWFIFNIWLIFSKKQDWWYLRYSLPKSGAVTTTWLRWYSCSRSTAHHGCPRSFPVHDAPLPTVKPSTATFAGDTYVLIWRAVLWSAKFSATHSQSAKIFSSCLQRILQKI